MDLPDNLELPLTRGAPWFYWLGGRPALDFVNTRRERWWRDVETLVSPADLDEWVVQAGLQIRPPEFEAPLVSAARELREAVNTVCMSYLHDSTVPSDATEVINVWLPYADLPRSLQSGPDGMPNLGSADPPDAGRHALGLIALDAAEMLGTSQRERIRVCASETCSARFFDRSRAAQRRWCSMEGCGNIAKARRHRARTAAATKSER